MVVAADAYVITLLSISVLVQLVVLVLLALVVVKMAGPAYEAVNDLKGLPSAVVGEVEQKLGLASEIAGVKRQLERVETSLTGVDNTMTRVQATSTNIERTSAGALSEVTTLDRTLAARRYLDEKHGNWLTLGGIFVGLVGALGVDWVINNDFDALHLGGWLLRATIVLVVLVIGGMFLPDYLYRRFNRERRMEAGEAE